MFFNLLPSKSPLFRIRANLKWIIEAMISVVFIEYIIIS